MEKDLKREADAYFTADIKKERDSLVDDIVKTRLIGYLARSDMQSEFYQCVSDFYEEKNHTQAKGLYIHGIKVPGFFSFTVGEKSNARSLVFNVYKDDTFLFETKRFYQNSFPSMARGRRPKIIRVQDIASPSAWPDKRDELMKEGVWETVFLGAGIAGDSVRASLASYKALKPHIANALKRLDKVGGTKLGRTDELAETVPKPRPKTAAELSVPQPERGAKGVNFNDRARWRRFKAERPKKKTVRQEKSARGQ